MTSGPRPNPIVAAQIAGEPLPKPADARAPTHYVVSNGVTVFVKEAEFFKESGGLTDAWGRDWQPVVAGSIGAARRKGARLFGITLSYFYEGER